MLEGWFGQVLARYRDSLALVDVTNAALAYRTPDSIANLLAITLEEALAIADGFVLPGEPPINDLLQHGWFLSQSQWAGLGTLPYTQIPLAKQAHLLWGVPLCDHAIDEILVLFLLVGTRLGIEGDDR